MILFDDIFVLPDFNDVGLVFGVVALDGCRVGAALVDRDLLWHTMLTNRLAKEP